MRQQWQQQAQDAQQCAQAERAYQYQQRGAAAAFQRQKALSGIQHGQQKELAALRFGQQQELQRLVNATKAKTGQFERDLKLYDRAAKTAKAFEPVHAARTNIVRLFTNPSAMGDRGAIFTIMKAFDPTSVVREGEQATAANAAGVPDRVRSYFNQVLSGKMLSDAQRLDMAKTIDKLYRTRLDAYKHGMRPLYDTASKYGLNPNFRAFPQVPLIPDTFGISGSAPPATTPGVNPALTPRGGLR